MCWTKIRKSLFIVHFIGSLVILTVLVFEGFAQTSKTNDAAPAGIMLQSPQNDFDGDGISDYAILRNLNMSTGQNQSSLTVKTPLNQKNYPSAVSSLRPQYPKNRFLDSSNYLGNPGDTLGWFIHNSDDNTARIDRFGDPTTDFWIPEDFDGDGEDDLAVWRGISTTGPMGGFFYVFQSSTNTVNEIDFGQAGDNPTVTGDYDGDDEADPAVFRCPSGGGQCTYFYRGSNGNGGITFFDWGFMGTLNQVRPYPGDFDGDGLNDFCVFSDGVYTLYRSSDGGVEYINWGRDTDPVLAPGDYDRDGRTDFMNVRQVNNNLEWWLLERDGDQCTIVWGAIIPGFTEFATPGDYDGDGATDISAWRRDNTSNSNSFFYTLRSSDWMLETFEWGSMGDVPVAGWNNN